MEVEQPRPLSSNDSSFMGTMDVRIFDDTFACNGII